MTASKGYRIGTAVNALLSDFHLTKMQSLVWVPLLSRPGYLHSNRLPGQCPNKKTEAAGFGFLIRRTGLSVFLDR
jgi:hypothetical protein